MRQTGRRQFLIGSGALFVAQLARAQGREPDRTRTIGYLALDAVDPKLPPSEFPSTRALRKLGWIEGKNLVVERRFAEIKPERLKGLAEELVRKRVEVIIAFGPDAAIAAARATRTIPIVFFGVAFPVEHGLVDSYARPGRNVTGTSTYLVEVSAKRVELLREAVPAMKRISVLTPSYVFENVAGKRIDVAASTLEAYSRLGLEVQRHSVGDSKELEAALAGTLSWGAQAMVVGSGPVLIAASRLISEFALRHRLPSVSASNQYAEAGGLLSYGPSPTEYLATVERSMVYVDRILSGGKPEDLPVEQPRNYELTINQKTAKALGLKIPRSLVLRADRVIE